MTTYYAVATGNWSSSSVWSTTSGGSGGAGVPTASDDVILNAASGSITVTVNGTSGSPSLGLTLTCTGFTGTLSFGTNSYMTISGNITFVAGMTLSSVSPVQPGTLIQKGSNSTLTTGGQTLPSLQPAAQSSGTWNLADDLTCGTITWNIGASSTTINTNNHNINCSGWGFSNAPTAVNLGTSTITCSGSLSWRGGTINGTAAINCTYMTIYSALSSGSFGAVTMSQLSGADIYLYSSSGITMSSLNMTNSSSTGSRVFLQGSLTISGTLTMAGTSSKRILMMSNKAGTNVTVSSGTNAITYTDFCNITGAGAASWNLSSITGGSGDCGGNSGITFTSATTCYMKTGVNSNYSDSIWYTTSGGSTPTRVPLIQDTAVIDNNSFTASGKTISLAGICAIGTIDTSTTTTNHTFNIGENSQTYHFGSIILGSHTTPSNSYGSLNIINAKSSTTLTLSGNFTSTNDLSNGVYIWNPNSNGTIAFSSVTICSTNTNNAVTIVGQGTVTFSGTVTMSGFYVNGAGGITPDYTSGTVSISLGSSTLNLNSNSTLVNGFSNVTAGTSTIVVTDTTAAAKTLSLGGQTFYNLTINGAASAGAVTISGSNTFNTLKLDPNSSVKFTSGTTQTVTNFDARGTSGNVITIQSTSAGSAATISKSSGTVSCNYLSLKDSTATGGATFYAGASSTNVSGNSGWIFTGVNYPITIGTGSYSESGVAARLLHNRLLPASYASYTETGKDALLFYRYFTTVYGIQSPLDGGFQNLITPARILNSYNVLIPLPTSKIQLESGTGYILLESGSYILLE